MLKNDQVSSDGTYYLGDGDLGVPSNDVTPYNSKNVFDNLQRLS